MRFGWEESFIFWFGFWGFCLHDDGFFIVNERRVAVLAGPAPNNGYKRPWWRKA